MNDYVAFEIDRLPSEFARIAAVLLSIDERFSVELSLEMRLRLHDRSPWTNQPDDPAVDAALTVWTLLRHENARLCVREIAAAQATLLCLGLADAIPECSTFMDRCAESLSREPVSLLD